MKKVTVLLNLSIFLLLLSVGQSAAFNIIKHFPGLVLSLQDPNNPDTIYVNCAEGGIIELRMKTDNQNPNDYVAGVYAPLFITTDQPGITLDTQVATTFAGTAVENFFLKAVNVSTTPVPDPSVFPMQLIVGAVATGGTEIYSLPPGDHLWARLHFSVSQPTTICVDTMTIVPDNPVQAVTRQAEGYHPIWQGACCLAEANIPTLSEWGLIIFSFLLLTSLIFYLRRRTSTV